MKKYLILALFALAILSCAENTAMLMSPDSVDRKLSSASIGNDWIIVIDPAHGGKDPGGITSHTVNGNIVNLKEKEITLQTAVALKDKLTAAMPVKVIMTREEDVYMPVTERIEVAYTANLNEDKKVIFISIHVFYIIGDIHEPLLPYLGISMREYDHFQFKEISIPALTIGLGSLTDLQQYMLLDFDDGMENNATKLLKWIEDYID